MTDENNREMVRRVRNALYAWLYQRETDKRTLMKIDRIVNEPCSTIDAKRRVKE